MVNSGIYILNPGLVKRILLIVALLLFAPYVDAQQTDRPYKGHKNKREKLKREKIAFISNRLHLTSSEAESFWPIYNEYEEKSGEIHEEKRKILRLLKLIDQMGDKEAYNKMRELLNLETKHAKLRLGYLAKFAGVLDKKRAARVYIIEEKWKRALLKKLHKKGPHGGGQRDRP